MKAIDRIEKQKLLIEELGMFHDKEGFQPIAGRILALLLIMDKELYSFDEIVEELHISKSSASTALKMLELKGRIEYVTVPGDRKRYFQIRMIDPLLILDEFEKKFSVMTNIFESVVEVKADRNSRNTIYMKELIRMFDYFNLELNNLKDKFRASIVQ